MKKLIFLLLFIPVVCKAQVYNTAIGLYDYEPQKQLDTSALSKWADKYIAHKINNLWTGYHLECYNDSTAKIYCIFVRQEMVVTPSKSTRIQTVDVRYMLPCNGEYTFDPTKDRVLDTLVWEHRVPTFDGFFEYIEKIEL